MSDVARPDVSAQLLMADGLDHAAVARTLPVGSLRAPAAGSHIVALARAEQMRRQ